jgi:hypothetical protein
LDLAAKWMAEGGYDHLEECARATPSSAFAPAVAQIACGQGFFVLTDVGGAEASFVVTVPIQVDVIATILPRLRPLSQWKV